MKNQIRYALLLIIALVISSCGTKKVKMGTVTPGDSPIAAVVNAHYDKEVDFETLQGRMDVQYTSENRDQRVTVNFRMMKDDTIWMSGGVLGIPLAKVMITPESVQFYEKITGTYFDGDFRLLSDLLGTPLDFQKVQNLLLGQTIYDLRQDQYVLTESTRGYQLEPASAGFLKKLFLLDAGSYKVLAQQIGEEESNRSVTVTYPGYQEIQGQLLPARIQILASEGQESTRIDMDLRSVDFDVPVSFPFSIPSGFEEITIE